MEFLNLLKKTNGKDVESGRSIKKNNYYFVVKTHLYGDQSEEEAKAEIIEEFLKEDPEAILHIEYDADQERKEAVWGKEEKIYPVCFLVQVETVISELTAISCIGVGVLDLNITDAEGNEIYRENNLIPYEADEVRWEE